MLATPRVAADGNEITIVPSSTELTAAAGSSTTGSFSVINKGDNGYPLDLEVTPYRVTGENYTPLFTASPGMVNVTQWLHINSPGTQYLAGGKVQNIDFTLSVPAGTPPGGYYAVIFALANPAPGSGGVAVQNRVGDILYITVSGPVTQGGHLQAPKLPRIVFGSRLPIGLLVSNSGGLHFMTSVKFSVTEFGHQAFQSSFKRYVLPQTTRLISATWTSLPVFGIEKVQRAATVDGTAQAVPNTWVIVIRPWFAVTIGILLVFAIADATHASRLLRRPKRFKRSKL